MTTTKRRVAALLIATMMAAIGAFAVASMSTSPHVTHHAYAAKAGAPE